MQYKIQYLDQEPTLDELMTRADRDAKKFFGETPYYLEDYEVVKDSAGYTASLFYFEDIEIIGRGSVPEIDPEYDN